MLSASAIEAESVKEPDASDQDREFAKLESEPVGLPAEHQLPAEIVRKNSNAVQSFTAIERNGSGVGSLQIGEVALWQRSNRIMTRSASVVFEPRRHYRDFLVSDKNPFSVETIAGPRAFIPWLIPVLLF
ncbi:MAG: hypothetical protein AAFX06_01795 [Planctomycetota bacterium]